MRKLELSTPHFPFTHSPALEGFSKLVDEFTVSFFNWEHHDSADSTQTSPDISPDVATLRSELDQLDETMRFAFLQMEIYRRCLQRASEAETQLRSKREEKLFAIEEIHNKRGFCVHLPPEIISQICALYYNEDFNIPLGTALEGSKTWGNIIYKSVPVILTVPELLSEEGGYVAKQCSKLDVKLEDTWVHDHVMAFPSVLGNVPKGPWNLLEISCETDHSTSINTLEKCSEYLPEVHSFVFICRNEANSGLRDQCQGCALGSEVGQCKFLQIPLGHLHCASQVFKRAEIHTLAVQADFSYSTDSLSRHLSNFHVESLVTLVLFGPFTPDDGNPNGEELELPHLKNLYLWLNGLLCDTVVAFMSRFLCKNLQYFELSGLLRENNRTRQGQTLQMLKLVNERCKRITGLAFYGKYARGSDPQITGDWHARTVNILTNLQEFSEDGKAIFPLLEELLIPYHGGPFDHKELTKFLIQRRDHHRTPITLLKLFAPSGWTGPCEKQRKGIERLGLYAQSVVVGKNPLSINSALM